MINKFKKIRKRMGKGFTLIETLMAVLLLSVAIAGPLTIASKSLQATLIAKDQDTAFYLAQDGIEYVRWVRDTNTLKCNATNSCTASSWLAGLNGTSDNIIVGGVDQQNGDCVSSGGTQNCEVDSYANAITSCGSGGNACGVINYQWVNTAGGTTCAANTANCYFSHFTYTTSGGTVTPSIFIRTISIATPVGGNAGEASVTVTVSWCDEASACTSTTGTPTGTPAHSGLVTLREELFNWQ
jgi:prepilin-type N-terminal cleavage/methylation domain-containing protein